MHCPRTHRAQCICREVVQGVYKSPAQVKACSICDIKTGKQCGSISNAASIDPRPAAHSSTSHIPTVVTLRVSLTHCYRYNHEPSPGPTKVQPSILQGETWCMHAWHVQPLTETALYSCLGMLTHHIRTYTWFVFTAQPLLLVLLSIDCSIYTCCWPTHDDMGTVNVTY